MSDMVKYVNYARGIHQIAAAVPCDDTQTPAGPGRCPQLEDLKKEPDPTATLPAPGGAANGLIGVARLTNDPPSLTCIPTRIYYIVHKYLEMERCYPHTALVAMEGNATGEKLCVPGATAKRPSRAATIASHCGNGQFAVALGAAGGIGRVHRSKSRSNRQTASLQMVQAPLVSSSTAGATGFPCPGCATTRSQHKT